jgi:hypothetical protein
LLSAHSEMYMYIMTEAEPLMRFPQFVRKHGLPLRSAHNWKGKIFPVYQIGRVVLVKESEALAAIERFKLKPKQAV